MTGPTRRRASLLVNVDLDPIPGFGATTESWRAWLQGMLDRAAGHYQPVVIPAPSDLRAQLAAAQAQLAEFAEQAYSAETALADAEARLEAVRAASREELDQLLCDAHPESDGLSVGQVLDVVMPWLAALSAAPQPEPDDEYVPRPSNEPRPTKAMIESLNRITSQRMAPEAPRVEFEDDEPPASDEPACWGLGHAMAKRHGTWVCIDCIPAPTDTAGGQQ